MGSRKIESLALDEAFGERAVPSVVLGDDVYHAARVETAVGAGRVVEFGARPPGRFVARRHEICAAREARARAGRFEA